MKRKMWPAVGNPSGSRAAGVVLALLLCTSASADELRYLALGDSFTAGTGSTPKDAFPVRLAARWKGVTLENVAVNGYSTDNVIARELPRLTTFKPNIVSLAIGANDIARDESDETRYRAQVKRIFAAVLAAGVKPSAIFAIPQPDWARTPTGAAFGNPDEVERRIESFNAILRSEARAIGARYVDLWPLMKQQAAKSAVASDGLHPSARAYDEWAEAISKELTPGAMLKSR